MSLDVGRLSFAAVEDAVRAHLQSADRPLTEREIREAIAPDYRERDIIEMCAAALRSMNGNREIVVAITPGEQTFRIVPSVRMSIVPNTSAPLAVAS